MPYVRKRRTTRKPRKKASGVRKRTYKRKSTFRSQSLLRIGFPKTTMVKLRYVDFCTLSPSVGSLGQHVFSANSCFDPNVSGIGHQPMNFDEWSSLYNHYVVVGSKISAQVFFNGTTTYSNGLMMGVNLQDDTSLSTDPSTVMEQGLSRYRITAATPTANSSRGIKVSKGFSCKKFFNLTNPTDNVTRVGSGVGSSPTEKANFIVFAGSPPGSVEDLPDIHCNVIIDYVVIFSEPKGQSQS